MARKAVFAFAMLMFSIWLVINFVFPQSNSSPAWTQVGISHVVLGIVFALLILLRPKPVAAQGGAVPASPAVVVAVAAFSGVVAYASGMIFDTSQFKWLGVLLLLFASLRWSLPARFSRDTVISLIILYWIHPVPGGVLAALHRAMQLVSVHGAEYVLHAFNFRVWADGMVLLTQTGVLMVPEACSGLTTAATVLVCGAGIGILLRYSWIRLALLLSAGLAQVMLLNVVRIGLTAALADPSQPGWAEQFFHDSLGVLLLVSVVIVQVEAAWWRPRGRAAVHGTEGWHAPVDGDEAIRRLPLFWQLVHGWFGVAMFLALAAGIAAFFLVRCDPHHRAEMIGGVALDLVHRDIAQSERAGRAALAIEPGNHGLRKALVRTLLLRGKNKAAIDELKLIPASISEKDPEHSLLLAWGLVGVGWTDQAGPVVSNIAVIVGSQAPGVAMVEAEFAARRGDADTVASMVVKASRSGALVDRVRALYPYLAAARRWDAITASNINAPYREFRHALITIEAFFAEKDAAGAARVLTLVMQTHGDDPRLLKYFYVLAALWPDSEWESVFARKLVDNLALMGADELADWVEKSFRLRRPDLAWLAYSKLAVVDPTHPAVFLLPVWQGDQWFAFRERFLGLSSGSIDGPISLTPDTYYYLIRSSTSWKKPWGDIPLASELYVANADDRARSIEARRKLLDRARVEFLARDRNKTLSVSMRYLYAQAFELTGRLDEAHRMLTGIAVDNVLESNRVVLAHAGMYQRVGDWQNVYETLRPWVGQGDAPLPAMLMFGEAQSRLTLGVCGLETVRQTLKAHPYSSQAEALLVRMTDTFLSPEEALMAVERAKSLVGGLEAMEAALLLKTQRMSEAKVFNRDLVAGDYFSPTQTVQALTLPAAELCIRVGAINLPSEAEFEENASILENNLSAITSPFVKELVRLWLACYRSGCGAKEADIEAWTACGRDKMERAVALNQLTLLLVAKGKREAALAAARRAVDELPDSGMLRRILIAISQGAPEVVEEAFAACPADPEVWLAHLVVGVNSGRVDKWVLKVISDATGSRKYPVGTIVRAGDFLLRKRMDEAAAVAAVDAEVRSRGLVPAHVLSLRCAERLQDKKWALSAASRAIEYSVLPQPYLCGKIVELWGKVDKPDWDVLFALGRLRGLEPANPLWMEMLGRAKFLAGGSHYIDAMDQMKDALAAGYTNRTSYLLLAETQRRLGNSRDAAATLRQGLQLFTNDYAMLNNLAFTLAWDPETLPGAIELVPVLLKTAGDNAEVMDTIQLIYIRSGKPDLAEQSIATEMKTVEQHSRAWAKARLRLAQIRMQSGNLDAARAILYEIVKTCPLSIPPEDIYDLVKLSEDVEEKLFEARWPDNSQ
ncbi:MAG: archaeosortase/exosortase family protein [bacterium]